MLEILADYLNLEGVGRPLSGRVLRAVAEPRPRRRPDDAHQRRPADHLCGVGLPRQGQVPAARLPPRRSSPCRRPSARRARSSPTLGKHEIFTPTKTYPPMTVSELAAAALGDAAKESRMSAQASFALRGRNPDVLTCIANLSNDEVFTPPEFANRMLDTLAEAWAADQRRREPLGGQDGEVPRPVHEVGRVPARDHQPPHQGPGGRDPGPRRARRSHPDQAGVRHRHHVSHEPAGAAERVLLEARQRQALRSPRASPATTGNIWFERMEHTWADGKCAYCGASQKTLRPRRRA